MLYFNFLTCGTEQVIALMRLVIRMVSDILITIHSLPKTSSTKLQDNIAQVEKHQLLPIYRAKRAG